MEQTVHIIVKGRVQGVYYRATARDMAEELGLNGWVRNTPNGDVEAMATGSKEALAKFIDWCRRGPKHAEVKDVVVETVDEVFSNGFKVIRGGG